MFLLTDLIITEPSIFSLPPSQSRQKKHTDTVRAARSVILLRRRQREPVWMDAGGGGRRWRREGSGGRGEKEEMFHVIHKVPAGDSPYVRAKRLQLVDKDPDSAILWFRKAINSSDRVDSALKDMAMVMKQHDRSEEAIEAIKSFRHLCSKKAQESLDNLLSDLFKKCGRIEEHIELLKQKLKMICLRKAFNGKTTKTARSRGKKFQVSINQETAGILGNLGWAYMMQGNYVAAEVVYRKAQTIEPSANKACNLGLCLIKQGRQEEARRVLEDVLNLRLAGTGENKSFNKAEELMSEIESQTSHCPPSLEGGIMESLDAVMKEWVPFRSKRLPIFEDILPFRDQMAC